MERYSDNHFINLNSSRTARLVNEEFGCGSLGSLQSSPRREFKLTEKKQAVWLYNTKRFYFYSGLETIERIHRMTANRFAPVEVILYKGDNFL